MSKRYIVEISGNELVRVTVSRDIDGVASLLSYEDFPKDAEMAFRDAAEWLGGLILADSPGGRGLR